jgi:prepilin-type N-terminal cleavage/methylation domain-containing protein
MIMLRKSAFSLIELMICVAILALLSVLLVPSLKKSLRVAGEMTCQKNIGVIVATTHLYDGDYGLFPSLQFMAHTELQEYTDESMWKCPEDKGSWKFSGGIVPAERSPSVTTFEFQKTSYTWNPIAISSTKKTKAISSLRNVHNPYRFVLPSGPGSKGTFGGLDPQTHLWHEPGVPRWPMGFADGHSAFIFDPITLTNFPAKWGYFPDEYDFHNLEK